MNKELLGMSNEELIQWACKQGAVSEKELRKTFPSIELFCAQNPISRGDFIQRVVDYANCGYRLHKAIRLTKRFE